jgi:hypothetical protein
MFDDPWPAPAPVVVEVAADPAMKWMMIQAGLLS